MNHSNSKSSPEAWSLGMSINAAIPQPMHELKEAGVGSMELTFQTLDIFDSSVQRRCSDIVRSAKEHGIRLWTVHIPYGDDWDPSHLDAAVRKTVLENVVRLFKLAKEWGADKLVFHPSYEPVPAEDREERLRHCRESIRLLSREAVAHGVQLAVECLPRTCLGNRSEEIEYLIGDEPNVGVCVDVNHLFHETPEQFIRKLGHRIITTHISDNDGVDERHWLPGEGIIDWNGVLRALSDSGYAGAFMYETRMVPAAQVAATWETLRRNGGDAEAAR